MQTDQTNQNSLLKKTKEQKINNMQTWFKLLKQSEMPPPSLPFHLSTANEYDWKQHFTPSRFFKDLFYKNGLKNPMPDIWFREEGERSTHHKDTIFICYFRICLRSTTPPPPPPHHNQTYLEEFSATLADDGSSAV